MRICVSLPCAASSRRDLHRVRQVGAAVDLLARRAAAARTTGATEDVAEDVAEGLGEATEAFGPGAAAEAARHVRVDAGVAVLVVGCTLLARSESIS